MTRPDDIGLDLAHIAQSGPTPVSLSDQLREMREYTPEPTGLFALIARSVLGLEDVVSLILLESEWRSAANSPEARAYAQLLTQLAEREAALERVREAVDAAIQCETEVLDCYSRGCSLLTLDESVADLRRDSLPRLRKARAALATTPARGNLSKNPEKFDTSDESVKSVDASEAQP